MSVTGFQLRIELKTVKRWAVIVIVLRRWYAMESYNSLLLVCNHSFVLFRYLWLYGWYKSITEPSYWIGVDYFSFMGQLYSIRHAPLKRNQQNRMNSKK